MSNNFEWLTDEEANWPEIDPEPLPKVMEVKSRRWLWLLLVIISVSGWWLHWQIEKRLETTAVSITQDVHTAYDLYSRAAIEQDSELLKSVIAGSQRPWVKTQLALLDESLLLGRWSMGLWPLDDTAVPQLSQITVSPDLSEAQVVTRHTFATEEGNGHKAPITLEQTTLFRYGSERWLVVPPETAYWGDWRIESGEKLTLIYPQRDEAAANALLSALEAELSRACRILQLPCSPDDRVTIRLDSDPASLLQVGDPVQMLASQPVLNLPAPSLVGLPTDNASEQALWQGYKAHLVTAVLVKYSDWRCCRQGLFHQALIDFQLAQLDLRPWPIQASHYQEMLHNPLAGPNSLGRYWREPPVRPLNSYAQPQVYIAMEVLLHENPDLNPFNLQQSLSTFNFFPEWINQDGRLAVFNQGDFQRAWLERLTAHLPPTDLPLPTQDLLLLCSPGGRLARFGLHRYEWQSDTWTAELTPRGLAFLAGLPGDEGVLLQEHLGPGRRLRTYSWVDGREQPIDVNPLASVMFHADPVDENLLLYLYNFDQNRVMFNLADLDACGPDGCQLTAYDQTPTWSPDGQWLLLDDGLNSLHLRKVDEDEDEWQHNGRHPFWLTNNMFGYVMADLLIIEDVGDRAIQQTHSLAILNEAIVAAHPTVEWQIQAIITAPNDPSALLIAIAYTYPMEESRGTMVLRYDLASATVTTLLEPADYFSPFSPFSFSPDGRWLTVESYADSDFEWQLDLYRLDSDQHLTYRSMQNPLQAGYDWSADGRWLMRLQENFIHLSAPEAGYDRLLAYDFAACSYGAWVNKRGDS